MKNSKRKGAEYEREIANYLKDHGYEARRTAQYCGNTGDASDVVGLPDIHIECKFYQNRAFDYDWLKQAVRDSEGTGNTPAVFHRINGEKTVVTMRLDDWLTLYERGRNKA